MAALLPGFLAAQNCSPTYFPQPSDNIKPDDYSDRVLRASLDDHEVEIDSQFGAPTCGGPKGQSHPWISDDGDRVVFSTAAKSVPGTTFANPSQIRNLFVREIGSGRTYLISGQSPAGGTGPGMEVRAGGLHDFATMSGDGKWVTWASHSGQLPGNPPGNTIKDVFLNEVDVGATTLISKAVAGPNAGQAGNGSSSLPFISGNGRYIAFESFATNIHDNLGPINQTPGCPAVQPNGVSNVFLYDRGDPGGFPAVPASITWVSLGTTAGGCSVSPDIGCFKPSVSGTGCFVAFQSLATNLTPLGNPFLKTQVYLRDLVTGETTLVSKTMSGQPGSDESTLPMVSRDGDWVVFQSGASNLIPGDTNGRGDVFVWNRHTEITKRVSVDSNGDQISDTGRTGPLYPFITANGRFVFFSWSGSQFNGVGSAGVANLFEFYMHDRDYDLDGVPDNNFGGNGVRTIRVSDLPSSSGSTGGGGNLSGGNCCASFDGRFVVYMSRASDFVGAADVGGVDTNGSVGCGACGTGVPTCPGDWGRDIFRREMYEVQP